MVIWQVIARRQALLLSLALLFSIAGSVSAQKQQDVIVDLRVTPDVYETYSLESYQLKVTGYTKSKTTVDLTCIG